LSIAVYRITKDRYRDQAFSGLGGLYAQGRWTPRGQPVVYTSQSISLAVLEYALNYKRHGWLPASVLARATIPDEVGIESVPVSELPDDWRNPHPPAALQQIGQNWLRRATAACLRVPSAIVPEESNYLLNPRHPEFGSLIIGPAEPFNFDRRLARARTRRSPVHAAGPVSSALRQRQTASTPAQL